MGLGRPAAWAPSCLIRADQLGYRAPTGVHENPKATVAHDDSMRVEFSLRIMLGLSPFNIVLRELSIGNDTLLGYSLIFSC